MSREKWMQTVKSNGATRKRLGARKGKALTIDELEEDIKKQRNKKTRNGKLQSSTRKKLRQDQAAINMMRSNKGRKS